MADIFTGPVLHIKKCAVITIFRLKCHNQFYRHEKSSANTMCERDVVNYHSCNTGVTLDRMLSYRLHLTKTAGKLKNRNNLLMKLAGSTWGASANTLRSSALALCYSAALRPSLVTLCSHKSGRCAVELYHASHLWYPLFYIYPMASNTLALEALRISASEALRDALYKYTTTTTTTTTLEH